MPLTHDCQQERIAPALLTRGEVPYVFIASPLFNPAQIEIIRRIEGLLTAAGLPFYSARLDSGSHLMTPEERRDPSAWHPVMESNLRGLDETNLMIAVVEYAFPTGQHLQLVKEEPDLTLNPTPVRTMINPHLELPDAGTVWEMGYHTAQGKPVIAFHSSKPPAHLNLMLSHSTVGILGGFDHLEAFLRPRQRGSLPVALWEKSHLSDYLSQRMSRRTLVSMDPHFTWSVLTSWQREVE